MEISVIPELGQSDKPKVRRLDRTLFLAGSLQGNTDDIPASYFFSNNQILHHHRNVPSIWAAGEAIQHVLHSHHPRRRSCNQGLSCGLEQSSCVVQHNNLSGRFSCNDGLFCSYRVFRGEQWIQICVISSPSV